MAFFCHWLLSPSSTRSTSSHPAAGVRASFLPGAGRSSIGRRGHVSRRRSPPSRRGTVTPSLWLSGPRAPCARSLPFCRAHAGARTRGLCGRGASADGRPPDGPAPAVFTPFYPVRAQLLRGCVSRVLWAPPARACRSSVASSFSPPPVPRRRWRASVI